MAGPDSPKSESGLEAEGTAALESDLATNTVILQDKCRPHARPSPRGIAVEIRSD